MFKRQNTNWSFILKRLVFYRETLPVSSFEEPDVESIPSEGIRLKESSEKMAVHAKVSSFFVINPDVQKHKARWRLLSRRAVTDPKTKKRKPSSMQLFMSLKMPEEREQFLVQPHIQAEIELEYKLSKRFYDKIPATMKVPQITVNHFERPRLEYDGEMVFMGGSLSRKVSQEIGGQSRRIEGNDPMSLLKMIRSMSEEELKKLAGKPAIVSFDPSIIKPVSVPSQIIAKGNEAVNKYLEQHTEGQYLAPMRDVVAELKKYGAKVIMVNQLNAYGLDKGNIYGSKNLMNRVAGLLSKSMAEMYLNGQVDAVVDAHGLSPNGMNIRPRYVATENGQPTLNAKGIQGLANGVIAGINFGFGIPSENNATGDLGYYGMLNDGKSRPNGNPELEQYRRQMHVPISPVSAETENFMRENASDLLARFKYLLIQSPTPSFEDAMKVIAITESALLVERQSDTINWDRDIEFEQGALTLLMKITEIAVAKAEKKRDKKSLKTAKYAYKEAVRLNLTSRSATYKLKNLRKRLEKLGRSLGIKTYLKTIKRYSPAYF